MSLRRLLLILAVAAFGCAEDRDSPIDPGAPPLPLTAGTYVLYVAGDSFACSDVNPPQSGTVAQALATATLSGNEWIFRQANPSGGDFELRLGAGGTATTPAYLAVTGTMRGQLVDSFGVTLPPSGRRASFQTVQVNGEMPQNGQTVQGRFNGQVLFSRDNRFSVCPPGQTGFLLSRIEGDPLRATASFSPSRPVTTTSSPTTSGRASLQ